MNNDTLVKVENVSKKFCRTLKRSLWYGMQDIAGEMVGRKREGQELRSGEFWSVNDVSFELKRGECLGLIGPNGAGKSTLLKMLNGLLKPDQGRITMRGRVCALIELGAGFNPILTGRENIYINGAVLGFSKAEIDKKFDAIVDFSEMGDFLDTPVQNYSSGMRVRLGFAVAAQMEPDVLLIDEVLAVGDAKFRAKCLNVISSIAKNASIVFVSHAMPQISRICTNILSLKSGGQKYFGNDIPYAIETYYESVEVFNKGPQTEAYSFCLEDVSLSSDSMECEKGNEKVFFGKEFKALLKFRAKVLSKEFLINIAFFDMELKGVAQCSSFHSEFSVQSTSEIFSIEMCLDSLLLNPGRYVMQVALVEKLGGARRGEVLYLNQSAISFSVSGSLTGYTPVQLIGKWKYES